MQKIITLILLLCVQNAFGWGQIGHRVVGEIAEQNLSKSTKAKLRKIMNDESLAEAGTWADEMRSNPDFRHASRWHYVSIPDNSSYKQVYKKKEKPNIVWAMKKQLKILKIKSSTIKQKRDAIRWLCHLIGDIHQPLHVGRKSDKGGNTFRLKWFGKDTNLHKVWDSEIINSKRLSFTEFVRFYNEIDKKDKSWDDLNFSNWTKEAMFHRANVYDLPKKKGQKYWEYNYIYKHMPYIKYQLTKAGYRLAKVLESVL